MMDVGWAKFWAIVGTLGSGLPPILAQIPEVPKDFKEWPPFVVGGLIAIVSIFAMYKQGEGYRKTIDKQTDALIRLAKKGESHEFVD